VYLTIKDPIELDLRISQLNDQKFHEEQLVAKVQSENAELIRITQEQKALFETIFLTK